MDTITPSSVYMHYKGGTYRVHAVAVESTNEREGTKVVVYESLALGTMHTRDLDEFIELVIWPDGVTRARFIPAQEA